MEWLKSNQIYISAMTISTTENTRVGFFLGKGPHITHISAFVEWIQHCLRKHCSECPSFQLNVEGIGWYKDTSTKSRALVLICSNSDIQSIRSLLDKEFHSKSNFPFTPFPIMHSLDVPTQTALYRAHKARTYGNDLLEITIPTFEDLDTQITIGNS
jgi:hypothetical protein